MTEITSRRRRPVRLSTGQTVEGEEMRLEVPSRWADLSGPTLSLAVLRLRSPSSRPGVPIVLLAGGPGISGLGELVTGPRAWHDWVSQALVRHDIIAFDQRGSGRSTPSTGCGRRWNLPLDVPGSRESALENVLRMAEECRTCLEGRGVDLGSLTTAESVGDVDAIRTAIGVERVGLVGMSYGTHLGLAALRELGERIGVAVFSLVEPLDHTFKLPSRVDAILGDVSRRAAEETVTTNLLDEVASLINRLDEKPESVSAPPARVTVSGWDAQMAIGNSLGEAEEIAQLPRRVRTLHSGELAWLATSTARWRTRRFNSGMSWHMDAASGASLERLERIAVERQSALLGDALTFPFPEMSEPWRSADLGNDFRNSFRSDVPTMFVSGSFDGRTPPANVDDIFPDFTRASHVVIDGLAHDEPFIVPEVAEDALLALDGELPTSRQTAIPFAFDPL